MTTISISELRDRLGDPGLSVVDVRSLAAYNGWRRNGEPRGGHLPGAVAFPAAWLETVDEAEIARLVATKGIRDAGEVVVYGIGTDDAAAVADRIRALGVRSVRTLDGGQAAWSVDPHLPLERLARYDKLVHIGWLRDVLAGDRPEAPPNGKFLLFHVNSGVPEEYAEGHIPGAHLLDTDWLEDPADWNRRSPEAIASALEALGVSHDTTVVVYGRDSEGHADEKWPGRRAGQIAATRALMIMYYAGVADVRLLDGGYDRWVHEGNPVETVDRPATPVASFGVAVPRRPEVIVDIDEAKEILADPDGAALVSVRTWREHIGDVSGYDYIGPAGRIKGDIWGNCGTDAYHMQHYRNIDNTMRPYPEIAADWAEAGITPDKRVAFYCGTGWRASEAWFYAYLQGWRRIAVYDGGWFEWSQDPIANPIEIGDPADRDPPS
jgi:3-mercaptopyruvate sulfurtransferase SseA